MIYDEGIIGIAIQAFSGAYRDGSGVILTDGVY
jgi:hypothetical protein